MTRQQWVWGVAAAAAGAIVLAGCAATVRSYTDRRTDFTQYRTYAWGAPDTFTTGDPRLDNNSFFRDRLHADVDTNLAARGFEQTDTGEADVLLHYHVNITQRIDVNQIDQRYGYCEDCRPEVYDAGTLTLDMVDAGTGRIVWRGWAERSIAGVLDKHEWMAREIDEAVARILARLPWRL
jgi:PBP1b-binding outer membrane lipoprotein LpoB